MPKLPMMLLCIVLSGCMYQNQNGATMMTWPYEQSQAINPNTGVHETKTAMNLKALRTGTSLIATLALQNPWAAVTGAAPEAIDATADIAKAGLGARGDQEEYIYSHQAIGAPIIIGSGESMPIPHPVQENKPYYNGGLNNNE